MSSIEEAVVALQSGQLVVMPTDTVYGVAARLEPGAVEAVFEAKGRPPDRPLPVLAADIEGLRGVASFDRRAQALAGRFWPGPLTMVLPRAQGFTVDLGRGGKDSVAVRIPKQPLAVELLRRTGPLAVTSANHSDEPPALTIAQARSALGGAVSVYLDGGELNARPSTVVSLLDGLQELRAGDLPFEDILSVVASL